eukprot:TRINITY_DN582_c0_g3_i1.p3 TRINITY_DN582_c0_g3~~TRINITY_DN582_c0_g3_i1.p3  ORF type:complete len:210 (-),score=30.43 TRINITY_DN582_c0_g3_i1:323-952(-)
MGQNLFRYNKHLFKVAITMVLTESKRGKLQIGSPAPDFSLSEPLTGKTYTLANFQGGNAFLVLFICNHCPYVVLLKDSIARLCKQLEQKGVISVGISSNSIQTHPEDGPDKMAEETRTHEYCFPYLYDETQTVAKAYGAMCTPDIFLFDKDMNLAYHGQYDDARPGNNVPVTGESLRQAVDLVLEGKEVPQPHKRCMGCNIKWHPGNEP